MTEKPFNHGGPRFPKVKAMPVTGKRVRSVDGRRLPRAEAPTHSVNSFISFKVKNQS
jgi:hypothetical protein